jgi:hypothetical protein
MASQEIKKIINDALEQNDNDLLVSLVQKHKRVLSYLIRFAYDKDTVVGWRAIKAIGYASKILVKTDDEFLRVTMRKLLWSLSDESGGIGWAAPEILGEIVRVDPERFSDIIPLIAGVYEIEEKVFRPGVMYALASIAEIAPERVACYQKIIVMALVDSDPLVKIYALILAENVWNVSLEKNLWSREYSDRVRNVINSLKKDRGVAILYQNNGFYDVQVGEIAEKVLRNTLYIV